MRLAANIFFANYAHRVGDEYQFLTWTVVCFANTLGLAASECVYSYVQLS